MEGRSVGKDAILEDALGGSGRLGLEREDSGPVHVESFGELLLVRFFGRRRRHFGVLLLLPPLAQQVVRHVEVHSRPHRYESVANLHIIIT